MRHLLRFAPRGALLLFFVGSVTLSTAQSEGLEIKVTQPVTCDRKSQVGDNIHVHYSGTLASDGSEFDSSYRRGQPIGFVLGKGMVIKGWDQGLLDMCIGEGRTLVIPPELGYGSRGMGRIPGGSTLVFETKLMAIDGVELPQTTSEPEFAIETAPPEPTTSLPESTASSAEATALSQPDETMKQDLADSSTTIDNPDNAPADDGECHLLGPFAILVQGALGILALTSLVVKRWRERPRRPLKVWSFDVSKQVIGSVLLHLANLAMSMFSSGTFDIAQKTQAAASQGGVSPNPCSFYLLNLAIDTTIGIPILVVLLRVFQALFSRTPFANPPESIKSGHYGHPPHATWWLKQSLIYFLGLLGMKSCVFMIFLLLPGIAWFGDWALKWTEGNEALQIAFVMFVFPLCMNALQYYIIDSFIKEGGVEVEKDTAASGHGEDDEGRRPLRSSSLDEDTLDVDVIDAVDDKVAVKNSTSRVKTSGLDKEADTSPVDIRRSNSGRSENRGGEDHLAQSAGSDEPLLGREREGQRARSQSKDKAL